MKRERNQLKNRHFETDKRIVPSNELIQDIIPMCLYTKFEHDLSTRLFLNVETKLVGQTNTQTNTRTLNLVSSQV